MIADDVCVYHVTKLSRDSKERGLAIFISDISPKHRVATYDAAFVMMFFSTLLELSSTLGFLASSMLVELALRFIFVVVGVCVALLLWRRVSLWNCCAVELLCLQH